MLSFARLLLLVAAIAGHLLWASTAVAQSRPEVFGEFVGNSPAGQPVREFFQIPPRANADIISWRLILLHDPNTQAPTTFHLRCEYGPAVPNTPGLGSQRTALERRDSWRIAKGIQSTPDAIVFELDGEISFFRVSANVLHLMNRDRSLMVGTAGWSYTLYRTDSSEKPVDPSMALDASQSYSLSPLAVGSSVFGIFEGRSPCQEIARQMNISVGAGCLKIKWRLTLYQDPQTQAPATYKLEDTLHRQRAREGRWTIARGTQVNPGAPVFRLAASGAEAELLLLKGDDNVLFFLDQNRRPLVGHAEFSYTLNRRQATAPVARN